MDEITEDKLTYDECELINHYREFSPALKRVVLQGFKYGAAKRLPYEQETAK